MSISKTANLAAGSFMFPAITQDQYKSSQRIFLPDSYWLRLCRKSHEFKKANEYTNLCVFRQANCHGEKPAAT